MRAEGTTQKRGDKRGKDRAYHSSSRASSSAASIGFQGASMLTAPGLSRLGLALEAMSDGAGEGASSAETIMSMSAGCTNVPSRGDSPGMPAASINCARSGTSSYGAKLSDCAKMQSLSAGGLHDI